MKNNLRGRQRQRMSRRMVILIFGSIVAVATVITTIILQTGNVETMRARDNETKSVHIVEDQFYVNDFEIPAPVLNSNAADQQGQMNVRMMKTVSA
ncbi:MAG: hypothetical protein RIQ47_135, partial [Bacteroidota bacterium]